MISVHILYECINLLVFSRVPLPHPSILGRHNASGLAASQPLAVDTANWKDALTDLRHSIYHVRQDLGLDRGETSRASHRSRMGETSRASHRNHSRYNTL